MPTPLYLGGNEYIFFNGISQTKILKSINNKSKDLVSINNKKKIYGLNEKKTNINKIIYIILISSILLYLILFIILIIKLIDIIYYNNSLNINELNEHNNLFDIYIK